MAAWIGQIHPTVRIHNFYYDGTVEAKVYRRLRDRINAFETVVGHLQPIVAQVPTFLERALMAADPEEEGVLLAQFEQSLTAPPLRPAVEEMVSLSVEADLVEIGQPLPPSPFKLEDVERLFTQSQLLRNRGFEFLPLGERLWQVIHGNKIYQVIFYPDVFDESSSLRLMSFWEPLFEFLLASLNS